MPTVVMINSHSVPLLQPEATMAYEKSMQKDRHDPDPSSMEDLLANCPDLLREGVLPTLTRLALAGRLEVLTRNADSFRIRLQNHPSTHDPKR